MDLIFSFFMLPWVKLCRCSKKENNGDNCKCREMCLERENCSCLKRVKKESFNSVLAFLLLWSFSEVYLALNMPLRTVAR